MQGKSSTWVSEIVKSLLLNGNHSVKVTCESDREIRRGRGSRATGSFTLPASPRFLENVWQEGALAWVPRLSGGEEAEMADENEAHHWASSR